MHFAFAITEYFPFGGAQRDFLAVVTAMAKRGHKISIISTAWQGDKNEDWQYFLLENKQQTNHGRMQALSDYVVDLKQTHNFDAVIGFTKMTGLDIYFAADPCFSANKYKGLNKLLPRYRSYAHIERSLFSNMALKVFYLTEIQRQQYQHYFKLEQQSNMLLPVCIDKQFRYEQQAWQAARKWRQSLIKDKNKIVLLFVAADFKTKGLDRVINALQQLDHTQQSRFVLWIVGTGKQKPYQQKLEQLTALDYQFFGGQAELRPFYLAADYLVHPARKEAAGMVLAEAMAAKLPLCVTDCCGYAFLAEDDAESTLLDKDNVLAELVEFLTKTAMNTQIPSRGQGSERVLNISRAEVCADQIESWLGK